MAAKEKSKSSRPPKATKKKQTPCVGARSRPLPYSPVLKTVEPVQRAETPEPPVAASPYITPYPSGRATPAVTPVRAGFGEVWRHDVEAICFPVWRPPC